MSIKDILRSWLCPESVQPSERPFDMLYYRTGEHIRTVLRSTFPTAQIRIADSEYSTMSLDEFNTWLKNDCVSEKTYYAQHFDCDNFARGIRCNMFRVNQNYKTEFTLCYTEGMSPGGYHAFCIVVTNDDKVLIVEPQTDGVVIADKSSYKPDFIQL